MTKDIVIWPAKVLEEKTQPVTDFGPALEALLADLLDSVHEAKGQGIAANQIGVPLRVSLVGRDDGTFFEIINPEILELKEPLPLEEGCLSVPDEWEKCPRFRVARVKYQDRAGAWHEETVEDRLAHVFQHEIDHLDGTVFVMKLSSLKRTLIRQRMTKLKRRIEKEQRGGR